MRIGFIIPVLNAADHLAGTLFQIEEYGRSVVIEYTDPTVGASESSHERSLDKTYEIVEAFDSATFFSIGKVMNRCSALNKGLNALNDAEFIFVLQQGDFFLDIQGLIDEAESADVITTRRFRFWQDFKHFFLGEKEEIGFKNIRKFGKSRYGKTPYAIESSNGHALRSHNVKTTCMENVIANFRMITSNSKRERMFYREQKEEKFFSCGDIAVKNFRPEDVKYPSLKLIDESVSFLNLVPHPWRNYNGSFLDDLPTFPIINIDTWMRCFGAEYVKMFVAKSVLTKPRVLGINCNSLASQFRAEGYEFFDTPDGKFDIIVLISRILDIDNVSKYLKEDGKVIVVDSPERFVNPEYETMFLEQKGEHYSFAITRRSENG